MRYKASRKWHTKAQRSRQQKMKNGIAEIRKAIKKKTKTTTETKATKIVVVVLERRLDTIYNQQRWNTRWRIHTSSFSHYLLPNLNHSLPEILSFHSVAISTHLGLNNIIHHKHLLKDSTIHHLTKKTMTLLHSFLSV